jgi:hypothetical protein
MKTPVVSQQTNPDQPESADKPRDVILWGATEIARAIGRNERQVYHLVSRQALPVKTIGGRLCAKLSALMAIAD